MIHSPHHRKSYGLYNKDQCWALCSSWFTSYPYRNTDKKARSRTPCLCRWYTTLHLYQTYQSACSGWRCSYPVGTVTFMEHSRNVWANIQKWSPNSSEWKLYKCSGENVHRMYRTVPFGFWILSEHWKLSVQWNHSVTVQFSWNRKDLNLMLK